MSTTDDDLNLEKYRSGNGVESKTADLASDDNTLKQEFGGGESEKAFEFDAEIIAERIADWYDDRGAAIREYLSNAETACIRRAKMELRSAGLSVPNEVRDAIEKAKNECDYEPIVEVTYNRNADSPTFAVEDNGCGMTTTEYQVLRKIGYSASHDSGDRLGQFGMGVLSFAQLTGIDNPVYCETRAYPASERDEDAFSMLMYVTNLEWTDATRDDYGTRFEFPAFAENVDVSVRQKVDEFADGMRVPVLFRESDERGKEVFNEDYTARQIEDDYPDDTLVLTYEDEFFKAVMSPGRPDGRHNVLTYNISMPIGRNTESYGSSNEKFGAPWRWDFRGKAEDGPIVDCESDPSIVGLVPATSAKYERVPDEQKDDYIEHSRVPDDAIVMPTPASSRDSYEGGHNEFWDYVGGCLRSEWASIAQERFEQLSDWGDFLAMSTEEKQGLFRAYDDFGPGYSESDPDTIQTTIENNTGATVPENVCEKLDRVKSKVMVVPEGHNEAHRKEPADHNKSKIWRVIDKNDRVFVGKSISQKKAEIAWGLPDETAVVRVEDTSKYDEFERLFNWELLKDLPSRKLSEKLPDLDDDVADKWENASSTRRSNSGTTSREPESASITVRYGKRNRRYFCDYNVGDLFDALDNGKNFDIGRWNDGVGNGQFKYLILYDQTEYSSSTPSTIDCSRRKGIAAACVPNYVYEYLIDAKNAVTDIDEIEDLMIEAANETYDDAEVFIEASSEVREYFDDAHELLDYIDEETDYSSLTQYQDYDEGDVKMIEYSGRSVGHRVSADDIDATLVRTSGSNMTADHAVSVSARDVAIWDRIPEWVDTDAPEFSAVFGTSIDPNSASFEARAQLLEEAGELPDL